MKKIIFNSSMPRSGSTLMQNILGNNPEIYATPTSPVSEYLLNLRNTYTKSQAVKALDSNEMKRAFLTFCRYGLHGYFDSLTDREYIIDKSRSWLVNKNYLSAFYPNPKVICMVRDLRDIIASMEKNYRKHPDKFVFLDKCDSKLGIEPYTLPERITKWLGSDGKPVGITLNNLKEAITLGNQKNVLFIRFEDLCLHPEPVMKKVHEYLEIEYFNYDFNNINQVTHEDDKFHGIFGDHKIKNKIEPVNSSSKEILGEEICEIIFEKNKWYFDLFKYEK
jgi:sulfotransferase